MFLGNKGFARGNMAFEIRYIFWVLEYMIGLNDYRNVMIVFGAVLKCYTIWFF